MPSGVWIADQCRVLQTHLSRSLHERATEPQHPIIVVLQGMSTSCKAKRYAK
jgi:hypothetical protein